MKLLIVDDNPSIRRLIVGILGALADEVHECADGAEALAVYQAQVPDVVLMELQVGKMNGLTATRQIIASDPTAHVIIVTSYDAADLRMAALEAGARGYVLKENLMELRGLLPAATPRTGKP